MLDVKTPRLTLNFSHSVAGVVVSLARAETGKRAVIKTAIKRADGGALKSFLGPGSKCDLIYFTAAPARE
jgi:hypothetical protein